jgi:Mg2+/Co2+ transporter CorB
MILSASEKDGTLAPEETEMIRGVFKLDEHTVREAMIPRTRIRALAQDDTWPMPCASSATCRTPAFRCTTRAWTGLPASWRSRSC